MLLISGCTPITMNKKIPDGPPAFQAGWHNGCSSAMSVGGYLAGKFQEFGIGDGSYQHDSIYQNAYTAGWFACYTTSSAFTNFPGVGTAPLQ